MRTLLASLSDHPMALLRGIAELRGITLNSNVREEAAEQLAQALSQAGATEASLAAVSAEARRAWRELLARDGQMKVAAFARTHGAIRAIGPGRLERETLWRQPAGPAEELWYQGLIYRAFADRGAGPLEYFYIPDELRPSTTERPAGTSPEAGAPGETSADASAAPETLITPELTAAAEPATDPQQTLNSLAVDTCTLLAALTDAPLRVGNSGRWRGGDENRLRERFLSPDPVRGALVMALAQEQGWLAAENGRLIVQAQPATAWLRGGAWEQTTALFRAWQRSTGWNDLRRVPSLKAEGTWLNDPVLARRSLLEAIGRLDPERWYAVADFMAWIKQVDPDFQRPDGNYTGWYLRDVASERYLSGFEAWEEVEGRLIQFIICGPLFWLGAVAFGQSGGGPLFRLTQAGAYWIAGATLPELYQPAHLLAGDDYKVSAPLQVPLFDRFRLLRFTEPVAAPAETGQPTLHRITRHSLSAARAHGLSGEKIVQFLRRATDGRLSPRVEASLLRWDQHGGAVRVTKGAILRVEDASILGALRADPVIAPLLGEIISAQAILVKETHLPKLLNALNELGYTTRLD